MMHKRGGLSLRVSLVIWSVLAALVFLPNLAQPTHASHGETDLQDIEACPFRFETFTYTRAMDTSLPSNVVGEYVEGEEYLKIVDENNCTRDIANDPEWYQAEYYWESGTRDQFSAQYGNFLFFPENEDKPNVARYVYQFAGQHTVSDVPINNRGVYEDYFDLEDGGVNGDGEDRSEDVDEQVPPEEGEGEGNSVSCESKGSIAWVFCPIIEAMASVTDYVANNILKPFLQVDPLTTEDESSNVIYNAWGNVRTLANVLLVPVFLVLIFAQATSIGLDAYSVKKALPRLAIAVVGIQLSYFVAAIMIDFFNIVGVGIGDLLLSTTSFTGNPEAAITVTGDFSQVFAGMGLLTLLGTGGVIWAAVNGFAPALVAIALMILLPLALGVLLTFFVLILRQGLIMVLVAFSPLAFVAWVLPNTEKWFKQWLELFARALFMFPLIMGFIAGGKLLASLLTARIDTASVPGDANAEYVLYLFGAMIALGAPLLLVPATFKLAGSTMSMLGNIITNARRRGASGLQGDARDASSLRGSNLRRRRHNRARAASGDRLRFESGNTESIRASRLPGRRGKQVSTVGSKLNRGINRATHRTMDVEEMRAQNFAEAQERVQAMAEDGNDEVLFAAAMMGNGDLSKEQLAQRLNTVGKNGESITNNSAILASAKRLSSDPYLKQAAHQFVGTKTRDGEQLSNLRRVIQNDTSLSEQEKSQSWKRVGQSIEGTNLAARFTDVNGQLDHAGLAEKASTLTPQQMSLQSEGFWNGMAEAHATLGSDHQHVQQVVDKLKQEQQAAAAAYQARTGQQPSPEQLYSRGPAGSPRAQQGYARFMEEVQKNDRPKVDS